jgi:hypothetical protein
MIGASVVVGVAVPPDVVRSVCAVVGPACDPELTGVVKLLNPKSIWPQPSAGVLPPALSNVAKDWPVHEVTLAQLVVAVPIATARRSTELFIILKSSILPISFTDVVSRFSRSSDRVES